MIKVMTAPAPAPKQSRCFPWYTPCTPMPLSTRASASPRYTARSWTALGIARITPDIDLDVMQANQSLDSLLARLVTGLGEVFDREMPDRILVHGDTLTTMAATLSAYFRKIPVGHVEAGLRSGNIDYPWPEEVNRKVAGAAADLHFAPTETAAAALRAENVPADRIHVTGNTVIDALLATKARIDDEPRWPPASIRSLSASL